MAIVNRLPMEGGLTETLLWTNHSPSSSFPYQTLNLDFSKYDYIAIEYCTSNSSPTNRTKVVCNLDEISYGSGATFKQLGLMIFMAGSNDTYRERAFYVNETKTRLNIMDGFYTKVGQTATKSNIVCIPTKIYGLK